MTNKQVETSSKLKVKKPKLYNVVLLNDDYTSMEFVVFILTNIFKQTEDNAVKVMMDVHKNGRGIANSYSYEIAIEKTNETKAISRNNKFPLDCIIEEK